MNPFFICSIELNFDTLYKKNIYISNTYKFKICTLFSFNRFYNMLSSNIIRTKKLIYLVRIMVLMKTLKSFYFKSFWIFFTIIYLWFLQPSRIFLHEYIWLHFLICKLNGTKRKIITFKMYLISSLTSIISIHLVNLWLLWYQLLVLTWKLLM